jgi:hypothetical protein
MAAELIRALTIRHEDVEYGTARLEGDENAQLMCEHAVSVI